MAEFTILIRGFDNRYKGNEETTSLVPIKDTTKSLDLHEALTFTLK